MTNQKQIERQLNMKRIIVQALIMLISTFIFAQDFEVSPVEIKFEASVGETVIKKVSIRNYSSTRQQFSAVYYDYEIDENGKKVPLKNGETSKHTMKDWINISPSFFELNPNEERIIDVTLSVPHDGTGARWGKIGIQPAVEQTASNVDKTVATGVLVVPRITIWLTQSPKGNSNYSATIKDLVETTTANDTIRKFTALVTNTGGNIIEAKVFLTIANLMSASEKKYPTNTQKIYPGSSKTIELRIPEKLSPGRYVVAAILDYGHRKPLEGTQIIIEQK
ncbi:MAG TPA: hypothetical protein DDX39_07535 [Bacteroidales bacterium]|nr:MAG: hypothetical protein A2W98_12320 [Bacteroidetes bacterium GWF2_33_38]OFY73745.1 MAG: hypothetical protein A2265_10420 [Bacteroidetes bacterium RIFOXYA12_FULL_33_9]HBF88476.1 hypothetical protein [Bacteroidales bacterium]